MTNPIHPPISKLQDTISYRIARLAAVNERIGQTILQKELKISLPQWRVLGIVKPNQPITFLEVHDALLMDKGQLSRTIKSMVKLELLETRNLEEDARQIQITTTRKGNSVHERALEIVIQQNEADVAGLSSEECQVFILLMDRIIQRTNVSIGRDI